MKIESYTEKPEHTYHFQNLRSRTQIPYFFDEY